MDLPQRQGVVNKMDNSLLCTSFHSLLHLFFLSTWLYEPQGVVNKMDNSYVLKLPEWRRAREGPVQVRAWAALACRASRAALIGC